MSSHISPVVKCSIRVIESVHSTHELVVAAARAIIADAEFNTRFHSQKSTTSEDAILEALEDYERLADSCEEAYSSFLADPSLGTPALFSAFAALEAIARRS